MSPSKKAPKKAPKKPAVVDDRIANHSYELVPLSELTPYPDVNPRRGDVGAIVESFKAHGFFGSIVVQKSTGLIIAGNHRYLAAKQLGMDALPVVYVDVDDRMAARMLVADNRISDRASNDNESLVRMLSAFAADGGLDGTGYDGDDLDDLLRDLDPQFELDGGGLVSRVGGVSSVVCPACQHEFMA